MNPLFFFFLCYLLVINLAALLLMWRDKSLSKTVGRRRIPEKALFLSALLGGSVGAIGGMQLFRHKTKHPTFCWGMSIIFLGQLTLVVCLLL